MRLLRRIALAVGDLLRLLVLGAFPLGSLLVLFLGLGWADQGQDVLRLAVEQHREGGSDYLLWGMWFGTLSLALSIWFTLRTLLGVQYALFPMAYAANGRIRRYTPRIAGMAAPLIVAWVLRDFDGIKAWPALFCVQAALVLMFTIVRRRCMNWLQGDARGVVDAPLPQPHELHRVLLSVSFWAGLVTFGVLLVFACMPVDAPRVFGSAAAITVALASINFFGSLGLTHWPLAFSVPPLAIPALVAAALVSRCNDNHLGEPAAVAGPSLQTQTVAERFGQWRDAHGRSAGAGADYIVVASEGGGIRAGFWTAAVMSELQRQVPGFDDRVFALSGVSGGSVGLAAWLTADIAQRKGATALPYAGCDAVDGMAVDLLAPVLGGMLYYDLLQRFLPILPLIGNRFDRSRALERGLEQAYADCAGQAMQQTLGTLYHDAPGLPSLLLNATVVGTGSRALLSNLDARDFTDVPNLMRPECSTAQQALSGLAHHSARFPIVSPAGRVEQRGEGVECGGKLPSEIEVSGKLVPQTGRNPGDAVARLVDGGYFENAGISTAMELVHAVQRSSAPEPSVKAPPPRPVLLVLRNDPGAPAFCKTVDTEGHRCCDLSQAGEPTLAGRLPKPSPLLHEVASVLAGLYNTRAAHARLAAHDALAQMKGYDGLVCDIVIRDEIEEVIEDGKRYEKKGFVPPLGWSLSAEATQRMHRQAHDRVSEVRDALAEGVPNAR